MDTFRRSPLTSVGRFGAVVLVVACAVSPSASGAPEISSQMVVEHPGDEDRALEVVWHSLVANRVGRQAAAQALKTLDAYIGTRLQKGQKVTLYPAAIGTLTRTAAQKDWTAAEIGSLLVYVQKRIDGGERASLVVERVMASVRAGETPQVVLDGLAGNKSGPQRQRASR